MPLAGSPFKSSAGVSLKKMPEPISHKICVLYNAEGAILHIHRVVTLLGGRTVPDEEVEARAKELASEAGHDIAVLHTLRVAAERYDRLATYRVDVAKKELVRTHLRRPS
jgi:hypothetical protein